MANLTRLPPPIYDVYEWQERANCRGADVETFFPPEAERSSKRELRERQAKRYCVHCDVVDACLRHALSVREIDGVWGGLNARERSKLVESTGS